VWNFNNELSLELEHRSPAHGCPCGTPSAWATTTWAGQLQRRRITVITVKQLRWLCNIDIERVAAQPLPRVGTAEDETLALDALPDGTPRTIVGSPPRIAASAPPAPDRKAWKA